MTDTKRTALVEAIDVIADQWDTLADALAALLDELPPHDHHHGPVSLLVERLDRARYTMTRVRGHLGCGS